MNIDWQAIHSREVIASLVCATNCDSSFCCTNFHDDFNFFGIQQGSCAIHYIEDEFDYWAARDLVPAGRVITLVFDYGGQKPLQVKRVQCTLQGKCHGIIARPLSCKTYPFVPIIESDGSVLSVRQQGLLDTMMPFANSTSPCQLIKREQQAIVAWQQRQDIIRQPRLVLYIKALQWLLEGMEVKVADDERLKGLTPKAFWRRWEQAFASGQLIEKEVIAKKLRYWEQQVLPSWNHLD